MEYISKIDMAKFQNQRLSFVSTWRNWIYLVENNTGTRLGWTYHSETTAPKNCRFLSCRIMSRHAMPCHVSFWPHVMSFMLLSRHVMLWSHVTHAMSHHVASYNYFLWFGVMSCHDTPATSRCIIDRSYHNPEPHCGRFQQTIDMTSHGMTWVHLSWKEFSCHEIMFLLTVTVMSRF